MARLWHRMTEIYGHKFISSYGEEPNDSWCRLMQDVTPEQIANGLERLTERDDPWPPTGLEFRNLCVNRLSDIEWQQKRLQESVPALDSPKCDIDTGLAEMAHIKNMLGA